MTNEPSPNTDAGGKWAREQLTASRSENVAAELRKMIEDSRQPLVKGEDSIGFINTDLLMIKLTAYYVRLSASTFNHAFALGVEETKKGLK